MLTPLRRRAKKQRRPAGVLFLTAVLIATAVLGGVFISPKTAQAAPTRVQSVLTGTAALGSTLTTANLAAPAAAGNLLIASISISNTGGVDPSIQIPTGYNQAGSTLVVPTGLGSGPSVGALFYKIAAGGEQNVTISWTGSYSAVIHLVEYNSATGFLAQGSVLDTTVLNTAVSPSGGSGTPSVTGGAMEQASEVLYSFVTQTGTVTASLPTGGFAIVNQGTSASGSGTSKADLDAGLEKLVDAAETPTAGETLSTAARAWGMFIAGFKVGASGPPGSTTSAFGTTYSSQSPSGSINDTTTPGQITLNSGNPTGTLVSSTFDTKAQNGAGPLLLQWNGSLTGSASIALTNYAFNSNANLIGMNCNMESPNNCAGELDPQTGQGWKVYVDDSTGAYHGWAWSSSYGWFAFNCDQESPNNCAGELDPQTGQGWKVYETTGSYPRRVKGWAWSSIAGWVAMSCDTPSLSVCNANWDTGTGGGAGNFNSVWVDASGNYHGWAWSSIIGWVSFDCANRASGTYSCTGPGGNYKVTRSSGGTTGKVMLSFATSNASGGPWTFYGPNCSDVALGGSWYEPAAGAPVNIGCYAQHWNKRYFRYQARLCFNSACSVSSGTSPTVTDITVNWLK